MTQENQSDPKIIPLDDGGFFITYQSDYLSNSWDIYGQKYTSNGSQVDGNFILSPNSNVANFQAWPAIANLKSGNFVVTWTASQGNGDSVTVANAVDTEDLDVWAQFLTLIKTLWGQRFE